jgi:phosphoribosyl 1,2-cyclic phosphate phosphodiesterase
MHITLLGSWDTLWTPVQWSNTLASLDALSNRLSKRYRFGIFIQTDTTKILIDTNPDLKWQALEFNIDIHNVDAVIVSHTHSDHVNGMGEFRKRKNIPLYIPSHPLAQKHIDYFWYLQREGVFAFTNYESFESFKIGDISVTPIPLNHGFPTWWFVITDGKKKIVIASDTNPELETETLYHMKDADILFIDWFSEDVNQIHELYNDIWEPIDIINNDNWYHCTFVEAITLWKELHAKKTVLVHMSRYVRPHNTLIKAYESDFVIVGYDWLSINCK